MSRTLTAMFDSRAAADAAKARLMAANVDASNVRIVDQSSAGQSSTGMTGNDAPSEGIWASLKEMFVSHEDRQSYSEGIRRGGYLLTADVEEGHADEAVRILDGADSVDFDERETAWKNEGWTGGAMAGGAMAATAGRSDEQVIPVIEEELRVGKREVNRGGARVRSYVREIPVNEQVSLREEHVSVERRPVDRALGAGELAGDMLRDRTIEMTETAEEAVIGKQARVVEEVVVKKTADTRVETVSDTVRRTEVEVDKGVATGMNDAAGMTGTSGMTGTGTDRVATGIGGTKPLDDTFGTPGNRR